MNWQTIIGALFISLTGGFLLHLAKASRDERARKLKESDNRPVCFCSGKAVPMNHTLLNLDIVPVEVQPGLTQFELKANKDKVWECQLCGRNQSGTV